MDGTIKQSRRFAELERLSDDYFRYHLASVMDETRDYLARKQGEEMKEYSTSLGGVLSMMASSALPLNDPYQLLKVTGEWNSKTTEDYVEMCKEKIAASEDIQHDLAYMAGQWRDAVVKEIGRTVRRTVGTAWRRSRLCLHGLSSGTADDRQTGERPYAQVFG